MIKHIMICDICKQEIERPSNKEYLYKLYKLIDNKYVDQDMCANCYRKLSSFIRGGSTNE